MNDLSADHKKSIQYLVTAHLIKKDSYNLNDLIIETVYIDFYVGKKVLELKNDADKLEKEPSAD